MLEDVTYGKLEQIIELAREAEAQPRDRSADQRGPVTHEPPLRPQPARNWQAAFLRYLEDMPDTALAEVEAVYHFGAGHADRLEGALKRVFDEKTPKPARIAFLASRADLAPALRAALDNWH